MGLVLEENSPLVFFKAFKTLTVKFPPLKLFHHRHIAYFGFLKITN